MAAIKSTKKSFSFWKLLLVFSCFFSLKTFAQPSNDDKINALQIGNISGYCSANGEFTNTGATPDGTNSCTGGVHVNVWFKFTANPNGTIEILLKTGGVLGTIKHGVLTLFDAAGNILDCHGWYRNDATVTKRVRKKDLVPGQEYYVSVDRMASIGVSGTFTLCVDDKYNYDYDDKEGAYEINSMDNWCSGNAEFSTTGAKGTGPNYSCLGGPPVTNRWFKFKATSNTIEIVVKTGDIYGNGSFQVSTLTDSAGNELDCHSWYRYDAHPINRLRYTALVPGDWYYIIVDNRGGEYFGSFTLCVDDEIHYDYNDKEGAYEITNIDNWCSANAEFTTIGARGPGPDYVCLGSKPYYNRWFKFQATGNSVEVNIKTGGEFGTSGFPVGILTDSSGVELDCYGWDRNIAHPDVKLTNSQLQIGNWYYLIVDNRPGEYFGSFTLCVNNEVSYDYDFKNGAFELTDLNNWTSEFRQFSNIEATPDETRPFCFNEEPFANVWFKLQATTSNIDLIVRTGDSFGTIQNPRLALYDANGNIIKCQDGFSNSFVHTRLKAQGVLNPGSWYYVSVDSRFAEITKGTFTLSASDQILIDYDEKAGAYQIPNLNNWCSANKEFTTEGATASNSLTYCNGLNELTSRWFKFTATTNEIEAKILYNAYNTHLGSIKEPVFVLQNQAGDQLSCKYHRSFSQDTNTVSIKYNSLVPGNVYYLIVDNSKGINYSGSFTLCAKDVIDWTIDDKEGAYTILNATNWCSELQEFTVLGATPDLSYVTCWAEPAINNVWFKFQATANTELIQVKTGDEFGTLYNPRVSLYSASHGTFIECLDENTRVKVASIKAGGLVIGDWYFFTIDARGQDSPGTFTVCVKDSYQFADNELKDDAVYIPSLENWCSDSPGNPPNSFSTKDAIADGTVSGCHSGAISNVWFRFIGNSNPNLIVTLKTNLNSNSIKQPVVSVLDAEGEKICSNDLDANNEVTLELTNLSEGSEYYIQVDNLGSTDNGGDFVLCLQQTSNEQDYDFKEGAHEIPNTDNWCNSFGDFTTQGATSDGIAPPCWGALDFSSRWFKFTASATGSIDVKVSKPDVVPPVAAFGPVIQNISLPRLALLDGNSNVLSCMDFFINGYNEARVISNSLVPGEIYYILVDNQASTSYSGKFKICVSTTINWDYDHKVGAFQLTNLNNWQSSLAQFSTLGASPDSLYPSCWKSMDFYSRWFKFQATFTGNIDLKVKSGAEFGSMSLPRIVLYDINNNEIQCRFQIPSDGTTQTARVINTNLIPGNWYYLMVDNHRSRYYGGSFTLFASDQIQWDYDHKEGAFKLTDLNNWESAPGQFSTSEATSDSMFVHCWGSYDYSSRWFKFTATSTHSVDAVVKTGNGFGTLSLPRIVLIDSVSNNQLVCSKPYIQSYTQNRVVYENLVEGNTYYVVVDNQSNYPYTGTFTLAVSDSINWNYDHKKGAFELESISNWCSEFAQFSSLGASSDSISPSCWKGATDYYSRWFKFQATLSGEVDIKVKVGDEFGTMNQPRVVILDENNLESGCTSFQPIAGYNTARVISNQLIPGNNYYILVDNASTLYSGGTFSLCVSDNIEEDYDLYEGAFLLDNLNNWCSTKGQFSTINTIGEGHTPSCWSGPKFNRWFKFKALGRDLDLSIRVDGDYGTATTPLLAFFDASGNELSCNKNSAGEEVISLNLSDLNKGDYYYFMVDHQTYYNLGTFSICINNPEETDHDQKENAIELDTLTNWCSSLAAYQNLDATGDGSRPACWGTDPVRNVWFKFQATKSTIDIKVKTGGLYGTLKDARIALFDSLNTEWGCMDRFDKDSTQDVSIVANNLIVENWYFISVDNVGNTVNAGTFTLCIDDSITYDYNFYEGAHVLSNLNSYCSAPGEFSTLGASKDKFPGSCWDSGPFVNRWFKFQATTNQIDVKITSETGAKGIENQMVALWDASTNQLACMNRFRTNSKQEVRVIYEDLVVGEWYYIEVDNVGGNTNAGNFGLCISDSIQFDYDHKQGAELLTDIQDWCSPLKAYTSIGASGDSSISSCSLGDPSFNRWFKFQATTSEIQINVKTGGDEGTMRYPLATLWNSSNSEVTCMNHFSTEEYQDIRLATSGLIPGNWYYITVDNHGGSINTGSFSLCISDSVESDYDEIGGAVELQHVAAWCSDSNIYTTSGANQDGMAPPCWETPPTFNRWFKFKAITNEVDFKVKTGPGFGTIQFPLVSLWDSVGNVVACANRYRTAPYQTARVRSNNLIPGSWYYVSVDNTNSPEYCGYFTVCINNTIGYDYDDLVGAYTIDSLNNWVSELEEFSTVGATPDGSDGSCWETLNQFNRWFKFIATTNEIDIKARTGGGLGTAKYLRGALFTESGTEVVCQNRFVNDPLQEVRLRTTGLTPGQPYYISIDNFGGSIYTGSFTLSATDGIEKDYDDFDGALVIDSIQRWCSANKVYSTIGASGDGSRPVCWDSQPSFNRWFKFQASTNEVQIKVKTGGEYGTIKFPMVALFDSVGTVVACQSRYLSSELESAELEYTGLTSGNWYYVSVDNFNNALNTGTFTLCISDSIVWDYDYQAGAMELTNLNWCSDSNQFSTIGASSDININNLCWNGTPKFTRWFKFTANSTKEIQVEVKTIEAPGFVQYPMAILMDSSLKPLDCVSRYQSEPYQNLKLEADSLVEGGTYYLMVDNFGSSANTGTFQVCISDEIILDYDDKIGAFLIPNINEWCSGLEEFTTVGATSDGNIPECWDGIQPNNNRWFKFQAAANEVDVWVKTGGEFGTVKLARLALLDSTGEELLDCMGSLNSDKYQHVRVKSNQLNVGAWYFIQVDNDGNTSNAGTFTLCVNDEIFKDYDHKEGAFEITNLDGWNSENEQFTTVGAGADGVKPTCWKNGPNNNRWFKFKATTNTIDVRLKTGAEYGTLKNAMLAILDSKDVELDCRNYTKKEPYANFKIQKTDLVPGQWYYIAVDNLKGNNNSGSFTLCASDFLVHDYDLFETALLLNEVHQWNSDPEAFFNNGARADGSDIGCWKSSSINNVWFKFKATTSQIDVKVKTGDGFGTIKQPKVALLDSSKALLDCMGSFGKDYQDVRVRSNGLTPGSWYFITIDNNWIKDYSGTFALTINDSIILDYDDKGGAYLISDLDHWCSEPFEFNNSGMSPDGDKPDCWWSWEPIANVWFKFLAPTTEVDIRVKTGEGEGTIRSVRTALYNNSDELIACSDYHNDSTDNRLKFRGLTAGQWYYFTVDNVWIPDYTGTFQLCVSDKIEMDQDLMAGAIELIDLNNWCSGDQELSNIGMTQDEPNTSCWASPGLADIWYKFRATTNQIDVKLYSGTGKGTIQGARMALFDSLGTEVSCMDRFKDMYTTIRVKSNALTIGNWYYLKIDNEYVTSWSGTFTLCVNDTIEFNLDDKEGAIEIANIKDWCSPNKAYSNEGMSADGPFPSCWDEPIRSNVWFKFKALGDSTTFTLRSGNELGTIQYARMAVWSVEDSLISCTNRKPSPDKYGDVAITPKGLAVGNWYYLSVDNIFSNNYAGNFSLCAETILNNGTLGSIFLNLSYLSASPIQVKKSNGDVVNWTSGSGSEVLNLMVPAPNPGLKDTIKIYVENIPDSLKNLNFHIGVSYNDSTFIDGVFVWRGTYYNQFSEEYYLLKGDTLLLFGEKPNLDYVNYEEGLDGRVFDPNMGPFKINLPYPELFSEILFEIIDDHNQIVNQVFYPNPLEWDGSGVLPGRFRYRVKLKAIDNQELTLKGQFVIE